MWCMFSGLGSGLKQKAEKDDYRDKTSSTEYNYDVTDLDRPEIPELHDDLSQYYGKIII